MIELLDRQRLPRWLSVWDFTTQTPGALSLPTGLTFARASSGHTVQNGAAAIVTSGITSNDVGRIGRLSSAHSYGLYVEPARTNMFLQNRTPTSWATGTWSSTTSGQTDPTGGTGAYRVQTASGGVGKYQTLGAQTGPLFASQWVRAGAGTGVWQMATGNLTATAAGGTAAAAWTRQGVLYTYTAEAAAYLPADGRDQSAGGGLVAGARDFVVDFVQWETGRYPTSAVVTAGSIATRAGERLSIDSTRAAASLVSGRLGVYLKLRALAASSELAATEGTLLAWAAGSVVVDPTSTYLKAIDGALYSQTANAAISWSRYDLLEFAIEVGAGTTQLRWRVNGASVNTASFTTRDDTLAALNLSAGLDVCNAAASGQMPSIVEVVSTFVPGRGPF